MFWLKVAQPAIIWYSCTSRSVTYAANSIPGVYMTLYIRLSLKPWECDSRMHAVSDITLQTQNCSVHWHYLGYNGILRRGCKVVHHGGPVWNSNADELIKLKYIVNFVVKYVLACISVLSTSNFKCNLQVTDSPEHLGMRRTCSSPGKNSSV